MLWAPTLVRQTELVTHEAAEAQMEAVNPTNHENYHGIYLMDINMIVNHDNQVNQDNHDNNYHDNQDKQLTWLITINQELLAIYLIDIKVA